MRTSRKGIDSPRPPWVARAVILLALLPAPALAQQGAPTRDTTAARLRLDSLRALYRLPDMPLISTSSSAASPPAASLGSPTAFGAAFGDAFVGAGYQYRTRFTKLGDGAVTVGGGVGSASRAVAVEVTATSYSTLRSGFGKAGSVSLKMHRVVTPTMSVALGYENAVPWGVTDGGSSLYAVATRLITVRPNGTGLFGGVGVSVGIGNARFRSEHDVEQQIPGVNVFGSVSTRITSSIVAVADWTGQDLNVGTSVRVPGPLPISLSLGFADLTGSAGDGARFVAGAGWAFRYAK